MPAPEALIKSTMPDGPATAITPESQPAPDIRGALKAGFTPAEIAQALSSKAGANYDNAKKAGYSDTEIINHLVPEGNALTGSIEAAMHAGSGMVGSVMGNIAGLAATGYDMVKGNKNSKADEFRDYVKNELTYQPRTQAGNNIGAGVGEAVSNTIGQITQPIAHGVGKVGEMIAPDGYQDAGKAGGEELANQAMSILGAKYLPAAGRASAPYVGAGMETAANGLDKVADAGKAAVSSKMGKAVAGGGLVSTIAANPLAAIPIAKGAVIGIPAAAGAYVGAKALAKALRSGSNALGNVAERHVVNAPESAIAVDSPTGAVPNKAEIFQQARDNVKNLFNRDTGPQFQSADPALNSQLASGGAPMPTNPASNAAPGTPPPPDFNVNSAGVASPGAPMPSATDGMVPMRTGAMSPGMDPQAAAAAMAQAIRNAPVITQASSATANNAAAQATQGLADTATKAAGRVTTSPATMRAAVERTAPLTAVQSDVVKGLQRMGWSATYAKKIVSKIDPSITDPAQILKAAMTAKP